MEVLLHHMLIRLNDIFFCLLEQLLDDFIKKENIILEGAPAAEVLLGRDTRPSGEALLEAAKQVLLHFIATFFSVFHIHVVFYDS